MLHNNLRFFLYELKRGLIILCKSLFRLALILALISGLSLFVFFWLSRTKVIAPLEIGLSMSSEDENTGLLIRYLESQDSVSGIASFSYLDEASIENKMANGSLDGGIILPGDFYDRVNNGEDTTIKVYVKNDENNRGVVLAELLSSGAKMITVVESGLYATYDVVEELEPGRDVWAVGNNLLEKYLKNVFARGGIFTGEVYSSLGKLGAGQFYFLSVLLICLIVSGLSAAGFYSGQSNTLKSVLSAYGITGTFVSVTRVVTLTILLSLIQTVVLALGTLVFRLQGESIIEIRPTTFIFSVPVCFCIASFFHLVYSLTKDEKQGQRVLFWLNVLMIAFSGILIPLAYLAPAFASLGRYMPTYFWAAAYNFALYNSGTSQYLAGCVIAGLAGMALVEVKTWAVS